jgi:hypothetical protein
MFREKPGWLWLKLQTGFRVRMDLGLVVAAIVVAVAGVVVLAALPSRAQQEPLSEGAIDTQAARLPNRSER